MQSFVELQCFCPAYPMEYPYKGLALSYLYT